MTKSEIGSEDINIVPTKVLHDFIGSMSDIAHPVKVPPPKKDPPPQKAHGQQSVSTPLIQIDDAEQDTSRTNNLLDFSAPSPTKEYSDDSSTTNISNESDDSDSEYFDIQNIDANKNSNFSAPSNETDDSVSEDIDIRNSGANNNSNFSAPSNETDDSVSEDIDIRNS
ncbi:16245_t:CDS:2, partial [Racocetra fulgida]